MTALLPLLTRDPITGEELIATRLESPGSGLTIEGRFSLGWMGRLTPEQLQFVGLLLRSRNNLQKVATDLGVAYNTARARLDDVVAAVGGDVSRPARPTREQRFEVLNLLSEGDLPLDEALARLRGEDPADPEDDS